MFFYVTRYETRKQNLISYYNFKYTLMKNRISCKYLSLERNFMKIIIFVQFEN